MDRFHIAAKAIESDGTEGFRKAINFVGTEVALALLLAHLRRNHGSMQGWPADPSIDTKVNKVLAEEMPAIYNAFSKKIALFYTGKWYCFDNFSSFTVKWRNKLYPTAEHAYQAAKFMDDDWVWIRMEGEITPIAEIIRVAVSAHEAKKLGNSPIYHDYIWDGWDDERKLSVMEEILRAKLAQHPYVERKLAESKGYLIIEDSNTDRFWGHGANWDGHNHLGRLWMKIRDQ